MCMIKKKKKKLLSESVETTETKSKIGQSLSASKVAIMHKKREGRNTELKTETEMRAQLQAAQMAMGHMPNTTLVDRLHAQKDKKLSQEVATTSKMGDIQFSLIAPVKRRELSKEKLSKEKMSKEKTMSLEKSRSKEKMSKEQDKPKSVPKEGAGGRPQALKDDDTLHPLNKPTALISADQMDEEFVEDEIEEPNSENYMYNEKEIYYTCHDMIRELNVEDLPDATGDVLLDTESKTQDLGAPLDELEKREIFSCQALRRNTFLSNSLSMPNKEEQNKFRAQKLTRIVHFTEGVVDLTAWGEDSIKLVSLRVFRTPPEPSGRTQQSHSGETTYDEKKTQEMKTLSLETQESKKDRAENRTQGSAEKRKTPGSTELAKTQACGD